MTDVQYFGRIEMDMTVKQSEIYDLIRASKNGLSREELVEGLGSNFLTHWDRALINELKESGHIVETKARRGGRYRIIYRATRDKDVSNT
jgi:hypothetical protein